MGCVEELMNVCVVSDSVYPMMHDQGLFEETKCTGNWSMNFFFYDSNPPYSVKHLVGTLETAIPLMPFFKLE